MNDQRTSSPAVHRIVIALSLILGLAQVILLGWTVQRRLAIQKLLSSQAILEMNISQLEEINQEELDSLQSDLDALEDEIRGLEASVPDLGAPFALYQRGLEIAQASSVDLLRVELLSVNIRETASGMVEVKYYSIEGAGSAGQCLDFVQALEAAGGKTLAMDEVSILPADRKCLIDLSTVGFASPEE